MRVYPECVYLRLEPSAHLIDRTNGNVRSAAAVEVHWKDGRKWYHRTFVANDDVPTMGGVLEQIGKLADESGNLEAFLDRIGGAA